MKECLKCKNLNVCEKCNEENDYFLRNGTCEPCSVEGCLDCKDEDSCLRCNEE